MIEALVIGSVVDDDDRHIDLPRTGEDAIQTPHQIIRRIVVNGDDG